MDNTHIIPWLAGLLEGEGFFGIGYPSRPNQASISLEMTDEDVISKVAELWNVQYCKPKVRNKKWQQTYKLQIRGQRAIKWMEDIYPYMSIRRKERIDNIIINCKK